MTPKGNLACSILFTITLYINTVPKVHSDVKRFFLPLLRISSLTIESELRYRPSYTLPQTVPAKLEDLIFFEASTIHPGQYC